MRAFLTLCSFASISRSRDSTVFFVARRSLPATKAPFRSSTGRRPHPAFCFQGLRDPQRFASSFLLRCASSNDSSNAVISRSAVLIFSSVPQIFCLSMSAGSWSSTSLSCDRSYASSALSSAFISVKSFSVASICWCTPFRRPANLKLIVCQDNRRRSLAEFDVLSFFASSNL